VNEWVLIATCKKFSVVHSDRPKCAYLNPDVCCVGIQPEQRKTRVSSGSLLTLPRGFTLSVTPCQRIGERKKMTPQTHTRFCTHVLWEQIELERYRHLPETSESLEEAPPPMGRSDVREREGQEFVVEQISYVSRYKQSRNTHSFWHNNEVRDCSSVCRKNRQWPEQHYSALLKL